ncbi:MAG: glycosyltransferase family 39 protein [Acidobacteria bacterium]|nr:glycosyltransferase family 39 protein [Acidobacteriota bacterium]
MGRLPLWGDEAESSINALTILQKGVPADRYQGNLLFQDWMIRRWPDNPEFEFRDISFSDRHVVVYHGWLPLYSIALSFKLLGISSSPAPMLRPQYDEAQRLRRTMAARLPSVLFGMLCIVGLYLAGCRLQGRETGLIAALLATYLAVNIFDSQTARYYASTAAGVTFCMWAALTMRQSARWRDFFIGGILFSLLFYTHMVAFAAACVMWAFVIAFRANQWRVIAPKALLFVGVVAGLCTPWLIATDYFKFSAEIPKAWKMLNLPGDLIVVWLLAKEFGFIAAVGAMLAGAVFVLRGRVSPRLTEPFESYRTSFAFVYVWLVVSYIVFFFTMPPSSFAVSRLSPLLVPPALLFLAMVFCSVAAIFSKRSVLAVAAIGAIAFVLMANWRHPDNVRLAKLGLAEPSDIVSPTHYVDTAVEYLRTAPIDGTTKLYAPPDMDFILTFYTGMFVQNIAPVRKSYLDSYPGDIILFADGAFWRTGPLRPDRLLNAAQTVGEELSARKALDISCELSTLDFRSKQASNGLHVIPAAGSVPSFAEGLWEEEQEQTPAWARNAWRWYPTQLPLFRKVELRDSSEWWLHYNYALVGPDQRRLHPNYENRIHNATLTVPPCSDLVVYYSPGLQRN